MSYETGVSLSVATIDHRHWYRIYFNLSKALENEQCYQMVYFDK